MNIQSIDRHTTTEESRVKTRDLKIKQNLNKTAQVDISRFLGRQNRVNLLLPGVNDVRSYWKGTWSPTALPFYGLIWKTWKSKNTSGNLSDYSRLHKESHEEHILEQVTKCQTQYIDILGVGVQSAYI